MELDNIRRNLKQSSPAVKLGAAVALLLAATNHCWWMYDNEYEKELAELVQCVHMMLES